MIFQLIQYAKARLGPRLSQSDSVVLKRLHVCSTCPHIKLIPSVEGESCEWKAWCNGGCGCGQRKPAELRTKAKMLNATCPKGKWDEQPKQTTGMIEDSWFQQNMTPAPQTRAEALEDYKHRRLVVKGR